MTTVMFGTLQEFQPANESITAYLERVEAFIAANSIEEGKQVSVLLSVLGASTYSLLRSLTAPMKPNEKTFSELKEILTHAFPAKAHSRVSTMKN